MPFFAIAKILGLLTSLAVVSYSAHIVASRNQYRGLCAWEEKTKYGNVDHLDLSTVTTVLGSCIVSAYTICFVAFVVALPYSTETVRNAHGAIAVVLAPLFATGLVPLALLTNGLDTECVKAHVNATLWICVLAVPVTPSMVFVGGMLLILAARICSWLVKASRSWYSDLLKVLGK